MCHALVVQRKLARRQLHAHGLIIVQTFDALAFREHVVFGVRLDMMQVWPKMRARHDLETTLLDGAFRKGHPGSDFLVRREPEVGRILMPRYVAGIAAILGEDRGPEQQDIRPNHVLHCVKDARVAREPHEPGKGEIALDLERAVGVKAHLGFIGLDARAVFCRLAGAHSPQWKNITFFAKLSELRRSQMYRHHCSPRPE